MLLVKDKPEQQLLAKLRQLCGGENRQAFRCLHLTLSEMAGKASVGSEAQVLVAHELCVFIAHQVDDPEGQIFLCPDNDIFVLAKGLTAKHMRMIEPVATHFVRNVRNNEKPVYLYDLQTDCEKIIERVVNKLRLHEDSCECQIINFPLDEELIKTISERRTDRGTPEILLVTSDASLCHLMSDSFKEWQLISSAEDKHAAVLLYTLKAPDMVFLDGNMLDTTGFDVLETIVKLDPDAHIIVIGTKGDHQNIARCMNMGAKGVIEEPVTRDKLLTCIGHCPSLKLKT